MQSLRIFLCAFLLLSPFSVAYADDLSEQDAENWLGARTDLLPLAEEMKEKDLDSFFKFRPLNMADKGTPSYEKNLEELKADHPDYYARMTDTVVAFENKEEGTPFASAEEWAKLGDRLMLALYASNDHRSTAAIIEQRQEFENKFSPMMLAIMPKESKEQIEGVIEMLKSMENVSEKDRQIAEQYKTQLVFSLNDDVKEAEDRE